MKTKQKNIITYLKCSGYKKYISNCKVQVTSKMNYESNLCIIHSKDFGVFVIIAI